MEKKKKIFIAIACILVFFIIRRICVALLMSQEVGLLRTMIFQYEMDNYRKNKGYNSPFPEFARKFQPDKSLEKDLYPFCARYGTLNKDIVKKDKFRLKEYEEKYNALKAKVSANLDEYTNELIPEVTTFLNKEKDFVFPTFREKQKKDESQDIKDYRNLAEYWVMISKLFEEKNDYKSSLIIRYGIIYLWYDYERNYSNSLDPLDEYYLVEIACNSIMQWASEPKSQLIELSKNISKDLIKLAANDYKFSQYLESRKDRIFAILEHYSNMGREYRSKVKGLEKFKPFNMAMAFLYDEPMKYIDKPYLEIKDKLEIFKIEKENSEKLHKEAIKWGLFSPMYLADPVQSSYYSFIERYGFGLDYIKLKNEHKLAYLEFTSIALAINAYYSECNKMPESIESLNKWLGYELPKNRFTNKDYEINKKNPILYNPGVCPEYPIPEAFVDLFCYFKHDENERQKTLERLRAKKKDIKFYYIPVKEFSKD